jgi:uncharacterized delta-60 repeat protein
MRIARMRRYWLLPMSAALALALAACGATASGGEPDASFGTGGRVVTRFSSKSDGAMAVAVQNNGMIVVAGQSGDRFAVARYTRSGQLDPSFGADGTVVTRFGSNAYDTAQAVAIQRDGRIVVAGYTDARGHFPRFALARYTEDGELDATFGTSGKVITDLTGYPHYAYASAIAIQPDGKIVVAGGLASSALVRYTASGAVDTSFGTAGVVRIPRSGTGDIALQSDGKIVVAETRHVGDSSRFALGRFTTNGTLDTSFGTGGTVVTYFTHNPQDDRSHADSIAIEPDGRIVVAGDAFDHGVLARYTTNGTLDSSFGSGGTVRTDSRPDVGWDTDVAIQPDGRIVVADQGSLADNSLLVRYTTHGTLDSSFGTGGRVPTSRYIAMAIAIQPDGKIVGAGIANTWRGGLFALARYLR